MFGTLKPGRCSLDEASQREHARFYCGLCKTLGSEFGQTLRVTLSNDAVFMALLADALLYKGAPQASYRCPMVPVCHRPAVAHDSPAMRYAGAVQILLGDQWLADRALDGQRLPRFARPLLQGPVARAQRLLKDLGIDLRALAGFELRQKRTENGHPPPAAAAEPTASALGLVFAAVADLPAAVPAIKTEAGRKGLRALGSAVGQVIYLTDALEDVHQDRRDGNFNPCLEGNAVGPVRLRSACRDLTGALKRMSALVNTLPWQRHRELITHILCDRLTEQARRAIDAVRDDGEDRVRPPAQVMPAGPRIKKALAGLGVSLAALFGCLWSGCLLSCCGCDPCCRRQYRSGQCECTDYCVRQCCGGCPCGACPCGPCPSGGCPCGGC